MNAGHAVMSAGHARRRRPPACSGPTPARMPSMIASATLGFPRIGHSRELKHALEAHWQGRLDAAGLARSAASLRAARWLLQKHHGISVVPSNDFSLYDHV